MAQVNRARKPTFPRSPTPPRKALGLWMTRRSPPKKPHGELGALAKRWEITTKNRHRWENHQTILWIFQPCFMTLERCDLLVSLEIPHFYVIGWQIEWQHKLRINWVPSKTRICVFAVLRHRCPHHFFLVFVSRSHPAPNCGCWSVFFKFDWPCAVNDSRNLICSYRFYWPRA